jgi:cyanate permease
MALPGLANVVDLALAIIVVELVVIALSLRRPDASQAALLPTVLSGLGLLLALRSALAGAAPALTLAALSFGGLAHIADLVLRLRRHGPR